MQHFCVVYFLSHHFVLSSSTCNKAVAYYLPGMRHRYGWRSLCMIPIEISLSQSANQISPINRRTGVVISVSHPVFNKWWPLLFFFSKSPSEQAVGAGAQGEKKQKRNKVSKCIRSNPQLDVRQHFHIRFQHPFTAENVTHRRTDSSDRSCI